MNKHGRRYLPELKVEVVLEVVTQDMTLGQVARAYGVHPATVGSWKKVFLDKGRELSAQDDTVARCFPTRWAITGTVTPTWCNFHASSGWVKVLIATPLCRCGPLAPLHDQFVAFLVRLAGSLLQCPLAGRSTAQEPPGFPPLCGQTLTTKEEKDGVRAPVLIQSHREVYRSCAKVEGTAQSDPLPRQ